MRAGECVDCGAQVVPGKDGVYREVTCWERHRPGSQAPSLIMRKETGRLLCSSCGESRKHRYLHGAVFENQQTLI